MKRTVPTTTLIVVKPTNYSALDEAFQLVRYELPKELRWKVKNAPSLYGQMHNALRDQLNCPYRTYMYDKIDANVVKWVVYAVYLPHVTPVTLKFPFSSSGPLSPKKIAFQQLPLHILLKLLQITFVRGHTADRFVGQDACYVHARQVGQFSHICLRIDINGDTRTQETDEEQEFKVHGHACLFQRVSYPKEEASTPYTYFGRKITQRRVHFLHLKRDDIRVAEQQDEPLYGIVTRPGKRTVLAYHDLRNIEGSSGKLLADFLHDFRAFLTRYGVASQTKERDFSQFLPPKEKVHVPLSLLRRVAVYDNRLNRTIPLQDYTHLFRRLVPDIEFVELFDLSQRDHNAVLMLQDHDKKDFAEGGFLEGQVDPYEVLYKDTPLVPKQSINVNTTEAVEEGESDDEDVDDLEDDIWSEEDEDEEGTTSSQAQGLPLYHFPDSDDKAFQLKLKVSLTQLYLKEVICSGRSVEQWLPFAPTRFLFLRKARTITGQNPYETALLFENDALHFLDLRDPDQRRQFPNVCKQFGVDWLEMEDQLLRKYWKREDGEQDKELAHYDMIIGPGLCVELEKAEERVLYDYDKIRRRQEAMRKKQSVERFKLLAKYDQIRPTATLSRENLQGRLLLHANAQPRPGIETESLVLYRQLEEFDDFLDDLERNHAALSLVDLLGEKYMGQIARIFHLRPNKEGKYSRRRLKTFYKKLGFLSDKAKDVQMYEGIWYDDENCYMIGATQPMNQQQARAHLIRHFDVYQGVEYFDIQPLLLTMSVQFVRYNQYTVYPYPFHLIDLYVENVLRYL